jgi:II/X family phage/plasmid replication protein
MLDTVKLQSPSIGEDLARRIEASCVRRSAEDLATGELLYSLTTGSLVGSYDSRVSVRVMRVENMLQCEPYLLLEASVHKALLGHNVYGGPEDFVAPCEWLVADVGVRLGVGLPGASEWLVRRVDWAEVYDLGVFEAVEEYVWGLNSAQYPRRSVARYGSESIFAGGRTTTVKAYHKGPEFSAHDRKRLKSRMDGRELETLQHRANDLLRWEVQVKAKKLDEMYQGKPRVSEISVEKLRKLHYTEVRRLVREGEAEVKTVRKQKAVRDRLLDKYDQRKAGLLLGTWHQLVTLGERETRRHIPARTFYRHKKLLIDAGVSWIGADVVVLPSSHSKLPEDFAPTEHSPYRLSGEDLAVSSKLAPYRAA